MQSAFEGRKEIWISLKTGLKREAEAASHAVLADLEQQFSAARQARDTVKREEAFLASEDFDAALRAQATVTMGMETGGLPFAPTWATPAEAEAVARNIATGFARPRPATRTEAIRHIDHDLSALEDEAARASLVKGVDEDGGPDFGTIPDRWVPALMDRARELAEAERRTLEAQRALIAGPSDDGEKGSENPIDTTSLTALAARWKAQGTSGPSAHSEMTKAIAQFEAINGPLRYAEITMEHARRFKEFLVSAPNLAGATKQKKWSMLRTLLNVAVNDGLLEANPFVRIKASFPKDARKRGAFTAEQLGALFQVLCGDEWWMARIALYTGARLDEICQLVKRDIVVVDGIPCFDIHADAEVGRTVKTQGSVRKVPIHRQLITDGFLDWMESRPTERLFSVDADAMSKRMARRIDGALPGSGKVFHEFRHTFKDGCRDGGVAEEFHDRLTGHTAKSVGRTYGSYSMRTLKAKIDLVTFGIEGSADAARVKASPA
nr:site-specific integrase [Belnapia moabensis]